MNFESIAQGGPTRYFYVFWEATILVPHNSGYYTKQPTSSVSSREMPNLSVFCLLPFHSRVLCETRPVRTRHEAREKCIHDLSSQVMEWSRPMFMTGHMTDHHRKSTTDHVTTRQFVTSVVVPTNNRSYGQCCEPYARTIPRSQLTLYPEMPEAQRRFLPSNLVLTNGI